MNEVSRSDNQVRNVERIIMHANKDHKVNRHYDKTLDRHSTPPYKKCRGGWNSCPLEVTTSVESVRRMTDLSRSTETIPDLA